MKNLICLFIASLYFTFTYAQSLTSISPDSSLRGVVLTTNISGVNTNFQQGTNTVWLNQGAAIVPVGLSSAISNTEISADVFVNSFNPCGNYDLNVLNATDGQLTLPDGFYVKCPQVVSVNPDHANKGQQLTVNISTSNTDFTQGSTTLIFKQGTSVIYATSVTAQGEEQISAEINVSTYVNCGLYDVELDCNQGDFSETNAFLVACDATVTGGVFLDLNSHILRI